MIIEQSQEAPEHKETYAIEIEDVEIGNENKIYVIDNGEGYSTMLLPSEY